MAPELSLNDFHTKNTLELNPTEFKDNNLHFESIDNDFEMFGRDSVIPDDKFGPDEERIFIEDEPYDFDSAVLSINTWENSKKLSKSFKTNKHGLIAEQTSDYDEESLKNIPKQQINNNVNNYLRNERGIKLINDKNNKKVYTSPEAPSIDMFFFERSYDKNKIIETGSSTNESYLIESTSKNNHSKSHLNTISPIITNNDKLTINLDKTINNSIQTTIKPVTNNNLKLSTESLTIKLPEDDDKMFDSGSEMEQIEDSYEEELIKQKFNINGTKELSNHYAIESKISSDESGRENDSENIDHGAVEVLSNEDTTEKTRHSQHKIHSHNSLRNRNSKQSLIQLETLAFDMNNTTDDTLNIFTKETSEDFVFEWVTTEWSKCSQTCGGGGFQMRGSHCMVRSTKPASNNTRVSSRTVIGASLCEDAGFTVPSKVRPCGLERCPQWHVSEWIPCESSRCFNWKTGKHETFLQSKNTKNRTIKVILLSLTLFTLLFF